MLHWYITINYTTQLLWRGACKGWLDEQVCDWPVSKQQSMFFFFGVRWYLIGHSTRHLNSTCFAACQTPPPPYSCQPHCWLIKAKKAHLAFLNAIHVHTSNAVRQHTECCHVCEFRDDVTRKGRESGGRTPLWVYNVSSPHHRRSPGGFDSGNYRTDWRLALTFVYQQSRDSLL